MVSGGRPSGGQQLGDYFGAIQNHEPPQDGFDYVYCIVDLHAPTMGEHTQQLHANLESVWARHAEMDKQPDQIWQALIDGANRVVGVYRPIKEVGDA